MRSVQRTASTTSHCSTSSDREITSVDRSASVALSSWRIGLVRSAAGWWPAPVRLRLPIWWALVRNRATPTGPTAARRNSGSGVVLRFAGTFRVRVAGVRAARTERRIRADGVGSLWRHTSNGSDAGSLGHQGLRDARRRWWRSHPVAVCAGRSHSRSPMELERNRIQRRKHSCVSSGSCGCVALAADYHVVAGSLTFAAQISPLHGLD